MKQASKLDPVAPNKLGDIVVYGNDKNGNGRLDKNEIDHSAKVIEVNNKGGIRRVESKEGQAERTTDHPAQQYWEYGNTKEYYRK